MTTKLDTKNLNPIEYIELKNAISKLDDDATVSPDFASFYLDMSEKTLANHRQKGVGPKYIQAKTSDSRNQSVAYKMGELRDWQRRNSFSNPMEAAGARGLCREMMDIFDDVDFWTDTNGNLLDVVSEKSAKELIDTGTKATSETMVFFDALRKNWSNPARQQALFLAAEQVIDEWKAATKSSLESGKLLAKHQTSSLASRNGAL